MEEPAAASVLIAVNAPAYAVPPLAPRSKVFDDSGYDFHEAFVRVPRRHDRPG